MNEKSLMVQEPVHEVELVDCDTCSCAPDDPGLWYYPEQGGWVVCPCSCHKRYYGLRMDLLDLDYDLAYREADGDRMQQIEEIRWELEDKYGGS